MSHIRYSTFFSALLLVIVILAWIIFLPVQFGGQAAYAVINGQSMEPLYHKGDLVVVRQETSYAVGDIVTYFNNDLHSRVIHRIVSVQDGLFSFKGDNNGWIDNDRAKIDRIIGKAWLQIPGLGNWLVLIQTPLGLALLAGASALIVLSLFAVRGRRLSVIRKKLLSGSRRISASFNFQGDTSMKSVARQLEGFVFGIVILFSITVLLGLVSFTRPETVSSTTASEYVQIGRFSYRAASLPGVYDSGSAKTGDPIFLKATCQVNLRFDYSLGGDVPKDVKGRISLRAESRDTNGWTRTFPLATETEFSGNQATVDALLNPCDILTSLRKSESKTELHRQVYNLILLPEVKFSGSISGQPVDVVFTPRLLFYLDDYQMYVLPEGIEGDPLAPYKVEKTSLQGSIPNMIQLPGFSISVRYARIFAALGLLLSLGLGSWIAFNISHEMKTDPTVGISLRYGTLIVDVNQVNFDLHSKEVSVNSFEDIVKLAERNATAILHLHRQSEHEFLVEGNNVVYRYRMPKGRQA